MRINKASFPNPSIALTGLNRSEDMFKYNILFVPVSARGSLEE